MLAFILTQEMDSYASSHVCSLPRWFGCNHFVDTGTIFLLTFMAIPPMIVISSLKDQYGCISLCILALVDGQSQSTCSHKMPRCSLSRVATLISSAVMQSGISLLISIILMFMYIPDISSFLFVLCLCPDNWSAMNCCGSCFNSILMLYWWIHNSILCSLCYRLATFFLKIATSYLWSVFTLKQYWWNFSRPWSMSIASHSILL